MAGPFVENLGPWFQVKTMASSVHGDIAHSKGFHLAEGISEVWYVVMFRTVL